RGHRNLGAGGFDTGEREHACYVRTVSGRDILKRVWVVVVLLVVLSACIDPGIQSELDEVKSQVTVLRFKVEKQAIDIERLERRVEVFRICVNSIDVSPPTDSPFTGIYC
ncbi:hypothetical protein LCGC14_3169340, partial [marine sediment metagenome]